MNVVIIFQGRLYHDEAYRSEAYTKTLPADLFGSHKIFARIKAWRKVNKEIWGSQRQAKDKLAKISEKPRLAIVDEPSWSEVWLKGNSKIIVDMIAKIR